MNDRIKELVEEAKWSRMMNDRIKELAEQAKGFADLNQLVGGTKGCMVYTYGGLEKFAELIVQECIDNLSWHGHDDAVKQLYWLRENKLGMK